MSRIGRRPVTIPKGVSVSEDGMNLSVRGPRGVLSLQLSPYVKLRLEEQALVVERTSDERAARAHHGLMRNIISNLVTGVSSGFEKHLEIVGVGFKAEVSGRKLTLNLGYSHPIVYDIPEGIEISVDRNTKLAIKGNDAQRVGQVAAEIRRFREPDAYKAKGIRYQNEVIKLKAGKTSSK